ncbi:iron-containing alcohol dehydrogenase [Fusibacter paucivorans]|uniref:Iron-containing alcohol dehydrogenase n=1 Tax=Fusibacter paucivorans TaxID=76009 RepID=A0ABS5PPW4_9FIRM|nr:iron-containing alcohol dehydrogenase [Fusibacter paucivorans]MBS7527219.1 iron-containing alcohol dehydrogenase [Fusibacter paucivorans]
MQFSFVLPSTIRYGSGVVKELNQIIDQLGAKKIMFICDKGIIDAGIYTRVKALLADDKTCVVFSDIEANPKDYNVQNGAAFARDNDVDLIVALGGGSPIDAAKAIAVVAKQGGEVRDYTKRAIGPDCLPIIAIPTTAGTGSEVTFSSVITDTKENFKFTVKSPAIAAKVALVDPELTYSLPASITAATGIDALTHAIEGYTATCTEPIAEALGLYAVEYIGKYIERAVKDGNDVEARDGMMMGSLLAGLSFSHADVAGVHCMAEALGSMYDRPHGLCNSIILPHLMRENLPYCTAKYARVARALGIEESDPEKAALLGIEKIQSISANIGLPAFKALAIDPKDFRKLAEMSEKNGSNPSNPKPMTADDYEALFYKIDAL